MAEEALDEGAPPETKANETKKKRSAAARWLRKWIRVVHRDVGYLVVGLTVVYALSGLAVNHIDDWNANFVEYERTHELGPGLPREDQAAADAVRERLRIEATPTEIYRVDETELEVLFDERTLIVHLDTGHVRDTGRDPRVFLRVANWLHLNRGKKAWTYIADGYALLLLYLALSGMFMLPGRKGLVGRGGVLVALGAAVPILYVTLSGGP